MLHFKIPTQTGFQTSFCKRFSGFWVQATSKERWLKLKAKLQTHREHASKYMFANFVSTIAFVSSKKNTIN